MCYKFMCVLLHVRVLYVAEAYFLLVHKNIYYPYFVESIVCFFVVVCLLLSFIHSVIQSETHFIDVIWFTLHCTCANEYWICWTNDKRRREQRFSLCVGRYWLFERLWYYCQPFIAAGYTVSWLHRDTWICKLK